MNAEKKAWIVQAREFHKDKYDYSKVKWNRPKGEKVEIICPDHGSFFKHPRIHASASHQQGCPACSGKKPLTLDIFKERARACHGNLYDYSKSVYTKVWGKIEIGCPTHGFFWQTAIEHWKGSGCPKCAPNYQKGTDDYITACKEVHGSRYDYSKVKYKLSHDPVTIACLEHGPFEMLAYSHLQGQGCPKCGRSVAATKVRLSKKDFLRRAKAKFGDTYTYKRLDFSKPKPVIKVGCVVHGYYKINPLKFLRSIGCPKCFPSSLISRPQKKLQDYLESKRIKVVPNYRLSNRKHVDIYLPDHKVGIEINGLYWHSDTKKATDYHYKKTLQGKKEGIQILHFWDKELHENFDLVTSMVRSKVGKSKRIYGRQTTVKAITSQRANAFLEDCHLQGKCQAKVSLGLFDTADKLVAVMTFGKPRFSKGYDWELIRFASQRNLTVVGGASKLLSYFEREYKPKSLVSYANLRFSHGNLYKSLGFDYVSRSDPSYFYYNREGVVSRYQAQKKKQRAFLANFSENRSEYENMLVNGYRRVYDCGNLIYSKKFVQ